MIRAFQVLSSNNDFMHWPKMSATWQLKISDLHQLLRLSRAGSKQRNSCCEPFSSQRHSAAVSIIILSRKRTPANPAAYPICGSRVRDGSDATCWHRPLAHPISSEEPHMLAEFYSFSGNWPVLISTEKVHDHWMIILKKKIM